MIKINMEDLIHRALANQAMEMKRKEMQIFLQNNFPSLSPDEIRELVRPIPPGRVIPPKRQKAVASITNQLESQFRELNANDRKTFVEVKLPSLPSKERSRLVKGLTGQITLGRAIPPPKKQGVAVNIPDQFEGQIRRMNTKAMKNVVTVQPRNLATKKQDDLIKELTRAIPPKRKPGKENINADIKDIGDVKNVDISPTGTRPIPPRRRGG